MTPSAKSEAMSAQQQPTHHAPWRMPIRTEPARPSRQEPSRNPRGLRHSEAEVLERRQVVGRGGEERRGGDPAPRAVPGQNVTGDPATGPRDGERGRPDGSPGHEVTGAEQKRRRAILRHARVQRDRRRDRREHHRGHHHDPHAEEPAEVSERGPTARRPCHACALRSTTTRSRRARRVGRRDRGARVPPRAPASRRRDRSAAESITRPRRTPTSTAPSCPRTQSRTR